MRITITVNEQGNSMVAVSGAPGKSCLKATEGLDDALGTSTSRKLTPEYNQQEQVHDLHIHNSK